MKKKRTDAQARTQLSRTLLTHLRVDKSAPCGTSHAATRLARGTPDGGPLVELGLAERRAAGRAGLVASSVDLMPLGGLSGLPLGIDVVSQRTAPRGDGGLQHRANGLGE